MTSIDDKIKQALNNEYNEMINDNHKIDANPFKQISAGFKGKMGWIYKLVMIFNVLFFIMVLYSIYNFYYATELKPLLSWTISIIVFTLLTQITKMWYWSELGLNRVIREVKILELQVAQLLKERNQ